MPMPSHRAVLLSAAFLNAGFGAHAQTAPDAGKLLREAQKAQEPLPPQPPAAAAPAPAAEPNAGPRVVIKPFMLTGVTLLPEAGLQAQLAPPAGESASLDLVITAQIEGGASASMRLNLRPGTPR